MEKLEFTILKKIMLIVVSVMALGFLFSSFYFFDKDSNNFSVRLECIYNIDGEIYYGEEGGKAWIENCDVNELVVENGTTLTFGGQANADYKFAGFYADEELLTPLTEPGENSLELPIDRNTTLFAYFAKGYEVSLTLEAEEGSSVTTLTETFYHGEQVSYIHMIEKNLGSEMALKYVNSLPELTEEYLGAPVNLEKVAFMMPAKSLGLTIKPSDPDIVGLSGSGTSAAPYLIATAADLRSVSSLCASTASYRSAYYSLTANIDLNPTLTNVYYNTSTGNIELTVSGTKYYLGTGKGSVAKGSWSGSTPSLTAWTPIGTSSANFTGTFNCNSYTISGIYINSTSSYQGLFGYGYTGNLCQSLYLKNSVVLGGTYASFLFGYAYGSGGVRYCVANSSCVLVGTGNVGGMVGYGLYGFSVYDSVNHGTIISTGNYCGGFYAQAPYNYWSGCYNNVNHGRIIGSSYTGGVMGYRGSDSNGVCVYNCVNTGSSSGNAIVGSSSPSVSYCYYLSGSGGTSYGSSFTSSNASSIVSDLNSRVPGSITRSDGTKTNGFYTKWTTNASGYPTLVIDTSTITINPNGGTWNGTTGNTTYTGSAGTSKSLAVPTRSGYQFAGWAPIGTNYSSATSVTTMPGTLSSFGLALFANADCLSGVPGNFAVYNNKGNGTVTHTRVSDSTNPLGSGYSMKITTNGEATPSAGGYYQSFGNTVANATYYQMIVAKIPKGYTLCNARNAAGDGAVDSWYDFSSKSWVNGTSATCSIGTGEWCVYLYRLKCGSSGTFSTVTHKYLTTNGSVSGVTNTSVTWYVGYAQVFKVLSGASVSGNGNATTSIYFGNQNLTLKAIWIPLLTLNPNGGTWNGTTANSSYPMTGAVSKSLTVPTRNGYRFIGWVPVGSNYTSPTSITTMPGTLSSFGLAMNPGSSDISTGIPFSVYNNNSNGTVTHTRVSDSTNPLGSGYSVKITTNGEAKPGTGGFHQAGYSSSVANAVFYEVLVAKIPRGYSLQSARNGMGDSAVDSIYDFTSNTWKSGEWNVPGGLWNQGTGNWQIYLFKYQCGSTGTFSTISHKYLSTNGTVSGVTNTSVTWYVGYSQIFKCLSGTTVSGSGEGTVTAYYGNKNLSLKAIWMPLLTINPNGGTFNGTTANTTYNSTSGYYKTIAAPTREGYTFAGWAPIGSNYTSPSSITSMPGTLSSFGLALFANADCATAAPGGFTVYNNSSNGTVTHTRISDASNPLGSGYSMKIVTNGTASPDAGGYYQVSSTSAGQVYYQLIVAKIPKGYELMTSRNAAGDNAVDSWYDFLTNTWITGANWTSITNKSSCTLGTGDWKVYLHRCQPGSSGSFSTIGFKYLRSTGTVSGTTNTSVTWYVGYSQLFRVYAGTTSVTGVGNASTNVYFGDKELTLKALWIPNTTLTINPNGGTWNGSTNSTSYTKHYGSTQTIADPTKTGYTFLGWLPTKTVTRNTTSGSTTDTWVQVFYHNNIAGTVLFSASDNLASISVNTLEKFSILNRLAQLATSSGYEFLLEYDQLIGYNRWIQTSNPATTSEGSTVTTAPGYKALSISWSGAYWGGLGLSSNAQTFIDGSYGHGNWHYPIGVNTKYGNGIPSPNSSITGTVTLWLKVPNGNLSNFVNLTSSFVNADALDSNNMYYYRYGSIDLQAIYKANTYTVAYNANGGTGTAIANTSHVYDVAQKLPSNTFTRTGYTFLGWSTSSTATTATYTNGQSVSNLTSANNATVTLYAVWKPNTYYIKYESNGGTAGTMDNSTHTYDASKKLTKNTFTRSGFEFLGWSTDSNATTATYTDEQSVVNLTTTNNGTVTLYAVWKPLNYTINFYDIVLIGSQTATYNVTTSLTSWTTLFSNNSVVLGEAFYASYNWSFLGWSTSATATSVTYNNGQAVTDIASPGETINLYAIHMHNITVSYNGNDATGGSVSTQEISVYLNPYKNNISAVNVKLPENGFAKKNYTFSKWAYGSKDGQQFVPGVTPGLTINFYGPFTHTFYAIWQGNSYTINYYNGTTKVNSTSYTYGTSASLKSFDSLNSAVLNLGYGWEFYGWINSTSSYTRLFADQASITTINLGDNSEITAGRTISLYAIYVRTITFVSGLHSEPITTTAEQYWNSYSTAAANYSSVMASPPQAISNNGWTALGYRADITAGTATFAAKTATEIIPAVNEFNTLYAVYSRTITITDLNTTTTATQYYNSAGTVSTVGQ